MSNLTQKSKEILLTEGIFLIIIGLMMIFMSQTVSFLFAFIFSIGLFFLGIYRVINSIVARKTIQVPFISVMSGVLLSLIGLYLILHPIFNTIVMTIAIAIYFIMESINSLSNTIFEWKYKQLFWVGLFTGIVQMFLAVITIIGLPFSALWIFGVLMGVNFVFSGITLISAYVYSKDCIVL